MGGCIVIYYVFMFNFNGMFFVKGGDSGIELGVVGIVFFEIWNGSKVEYRVLKINNYGLVYLWVVNKL